MKKAKLLFFSFLTIASLAVSACNLLPQAGPRKKSSQEVSESIPAEDSSRIGLSSKEQASSEQRYSANSRSNDPMSIFPSSSNYERSSQQPVQTSSRHVHEYGEWTMTVPPTCTESGVEERTCRGCGDRQLRAIDAIGHQWGEWEVLLYPEAGKEGLRCRRCLICGTEEDVVIPALGEEHEFYYDRTIYADGECAKYDIYTCALCNQKRITFPFTTGNMTGNVKQLNGEPVCYRLAANQTSLSFSFNCDFDADATVYFRGRLDRWYDGSVNNQEKGFFSGNNSSNGNFSLEINGTLVDYESKRDVTYGEMLGEGIETIDGVDCSLVGDCEVGGCHLYSGINTFTFTRLDSYTMYISDFVIITNNYTEPSQHEHNYYFYYEMPATCTTDGYIVYKCSCGESYRVETPMTGHSWGEWIVDSYSTCGTRGRQHHICTVCNTYEYENLPIVHHNYEELYSSNEAGENYIATTTHECLNCQTRSVRWSALDYDVEKSAARSSTSLETRDSGQAIRFSSSVNYKDRDTSILGSHIVYNVNIPASSSNAGLAFRTSKRSETNISIFDTVSNDSSIGYEYYNGELIRPESRYGLKIDGRVVLIDKDDTGQTWKNDINWYQFPVSFEITAGIHEIELYNLGAYRVDIYAFEITGLPISEGSHVHTFSDWQHDQYKHWKVCTSPDCTYEANAHLMAEDHIFGETRVMVEPTCSTSGIGMRTCQVCGADVQVEIPTIAHPWAYSHTVASEEEGINGYTVYTCAYGDGAKKLTIPSLEGTFAAGSTNKSGTPSPFMKLSTNNSSVSYSFIYDGVATTAKIYQRAMIDSWSNTKTRSYSTNGSSYANGCNFSVTFNGVEVDVSAMRDITYEEMLEGGEDSSEYGSNYSPINECLIGTVQLVAGVNSFTYLRQNSYNLMISDFVIVID